MKLLFYFVRGIFLLLFCNYGVSGEEEMWHQDLTNEIQIGPADSGYKRVDLRCLEKKKLMQVNIELDEEFSGVIYARGSFKSKNKACFIKPKPGTKFRMKIPFDDCGTKKVDEVYQNTLIIQYDDELIMPGDAAFFLECDLGPRNVTLKSSMGVDDTPDDIVSGASSEARISLADADPGAKPLPKHQLSTVIGPPGEAASFTPDDVRPRRKKRSKQEL